MTKNKAGSRTRRTSIRTRVLAIAFVPSIVLLLAGVTVSGYLVTDAVNDKTFATKIHDAAEPAGLFWAAVRKERALTMQNIASGGQYEKQLAAVRKEVNTTSARLSSVLQEMTDDVPPNVEEAIGWTFADLQRLPAIRQRADANRLPLQEAYDFYNKIIDNFIVGLNGVAQSTPDAETAYRRLIAMPLLSSAEAMSRADALAAAGVASGGLTEREFRAFVQQVGAYHEHLESAVPIMTAEVKAMHDKLVASKGWQAVSAVENSLLRGTQAGLPVPPEQWRKAAQGVARALTGIYIAQSTNATDLALNQADETLTTSVIVAAAILVVTILVFLVAWNLSNRLVRRLHRLRRDTLDVSEDKMPEIVERVRRGENVNLETEVSFLDHGRDEIGQVADAFNKAQQTAIAAAVEEAKTREGTQKVFLNIAHRSQTIVHRQLQALDSAERNSEDPDQLDMLFRLDHLSTRARRNAENLIILGGQQPGRKWRNPVSISDLVRGATAETEDYKRVSMGKMPAATVAGAVVGDLVHLLAELIDNATSFSPPQARVEIRGDIVGRGVVLEVEDQGLGMEEADREQLNAMLADPPDFSIMALSEEPRLGLFVVGRLAAKHGIRVTLRESAYGGTRAIVLIYSDNLGPAPEQEDDGAFDEHGLMPAVPQPLRPSPMAMNGGPSNGFPSGGTGMNGSGMNGGGANGSSHPEMGYDSEPTRDMGAPRPLPRRERSQPRPQPEQHDVPPPLPERRSSAHEQPPSRGPQGGFPRQEGRARETRPADARPPQGPPAPQPGGSAGPQDGRPQLPRRHRQQSLAPQLQDSAPTDEPWDSPGATPEQARSRLSAFQRGSRQAREQRPGPDHHSGD